MDTVMGQNTHQDSSPRSHSLTRGLHQDNPASAFQLQRCMGSPEASSSASSCASLLQAWLSGHMLPPLSESPLPAESEGKDVQPAL